jgi:beta-glucanase (GH16 family)
MIKLVSSNHDMPEIMRNNYWILSLATLLINCSSSSDDPPVNNTPPSISVTTTEFAEGDGSAFSADVTFALSAPSDATVDFFYEIEGQSASVGEDLEATSGSVSFAPGETTKSVQVTLLPDDILEFDESFLVKVSNIVNATMVNSEVVAKIIDNDSYDVEEIADGFVTPESYPSMELVWSDEFSGSDLNTDDWTQREGNGCPDLCGWGNGELQLYSVDNTRIENGNLIITAENPNGKTYTSSRLNTKEKQEFKYGRIDIRARLPFGRGIWPALWMLGSNIDQVPWPECGEIDIMELVGHQPGTVHGTAHYDRDGHEFVGTGWPLSAPERYADKFHVFSILWQEDEIEWYVDYNKFFSIKAKDVGFNYPFNQPFYFIANIAVGGEWPGEPDATTTFPQIMEVDYIRVFQTPGMD